MPMWTAEKMLFRNRNYSAILYSTVVGNLSPQANSLSGYKRYPPDFRQTSVRAGTLVSSYSLVTTREVIILLGFILSEEDNNSLYPWLQMWPNIGEHSGISYSELLTLFSREHTVFYIFFEYCMYNTEYERNSYISFS